MSASPRNTPKGIIEKINVEINAGLADPALKQRIAEFGETVLASSPDEFRKYIGEYTDKWAKVIRAAGINLE
jgi:tripartite-type tricarboxylate transporter receptor subunit TctC